MSSSPPLDRPRRVPVGAAILAVLSLAVPVAAVLLVPIYSRSGPVVWGWPFFYWYQVLWVLLCPIFTVIAAVIIKRARAGGSR